MRGLVPRKAESKSQGINQFSMVHKDWALSSFSPNLFERFTACVGWGLSDGNLPAAARR